MKISSMFHTLVALMAVLTFSMPFVTLAQENLVQANVVSAAKGDAEADINKILSFVKNAFGKPIGQSYPAPTPLAIIPTQRFLGKSPEYLNRYTVAYQKKAKNPQSNDAIAKTVIIVGIIIIVLYVVSSDSDSSSCIIGGCLPNSGLRDFGCLF